MLMPQKLCINTSQMYISINIAYINVTENEYYHPSNSTFSISHLNGELASVTFALRNKTNFLHNVLVANTSSHHDILILIIYIVFSVKL